MDFSQGGGKGGEISFYPLETEKTTYFTKNVMEKCRTLKSKRWKPPPAPPPTPMPGGRTRWQKLIRQVLQKGRVYRRGWFNPDWTKPAASASHVTWLMQRQRNVY